MTVTITQNTALTLAVVDRAMSPHGDLDSYNTIEEILASRDIEQLRDLALAAIWQLGTTVHALAPDTVAAIAYPNTFIPDGTLTALWSSKRPAPEGI